jgi:anti-sigma regulatory factor (Ser/Thr protein kinase)
MCSVNRPLANDQPVVGCHISVTAWCLPSATAARRARSLLWSKLSGHVMDPAVLDDLEVIVCELATNSYRHTDGPCELRVLHHAGIPVVCEIADTGNNLDEVILHLQHSADVDALADGGRGLRIVARLSGGRCGARSTRLCGTGQPGKSVGFAIPAGPTQKGALSDE